MALFSPSRRIYEPEAAISASNYGFPCAVPLKAGYVSVSRPGGIFLDLVNPARAGLNWKPTVPTLGLMDGHYLTPYPIRHPDTNIPAQKRDLRPISNMQRVYMQ